MALYWFTALLGLLSIALAIVANPWFVEAYIARDGKLSQPYWVVALECIALAIGLLLLLLARRIKLMRGNELAFSSIAVTVGLLVGLIIAELSLRTLISPSLVLSGDQLGAYVWKKNRLSNTGSDFQSEYPYDLYDPTLGWRPIPNFNARGIRTNSMGIRADREYKFERDPNISRIVILGDSFTWGEATRTVVIKNEETYPSLVEAALSNTEVINMGVHGWGTDQQFIYYNTLGIRFNPNLTILAIYAGNPMRNLRNFFSFHKPRFELIAGRLSLVKREIPDPTTALTLPVEMPRFYVGALLGKMLERLHDKTRLWPYERSKEWKVTAALLASIRRKSLEINSKFMLIYVPDGSSFHPSTVENAIVKWALDSNTPILNLREVFARQPVAEREKIYDGHWTAFGHRIVADALLTRLKDVKY